MSSDRNDLTPEQFESLRRMVSRQVEQPDFGYSQNFIDSEPGKKMILDLFDKGYSVKEIIKRTGYQESIILSYIQGRKRSLDFEF